MKRYFHQTLVACAVLGASLAIVGCEKNTSKPTGSLGNITGKVTPANAITTVTARDSSGTESFTTTPSVTGDFTFFDLKARTYSVTFTPATNFAAPLRRSAKVEAGETTDLGTISVVSNIVGDIKGIVSPLGAITKITATSPARTVVATPLPVTGEFLFTGLPPGNYQVSFTTSTRYVTPTPRVAAVVAGSVIDLDTIKAIANEGTITGRVLPLGSITKVVAANNSTNRDVSTTVDPATGRFEFAGLAPATYRVSCMPAAGFIPSPGRTAVIAAGSTIDVGIFSMLSAGNPSSGGTMTFKVNGASKVATAITASRLGGFLVITGRVGSETVSFAMSGATAPGVFMLSGAGVTSYGSYLKGGSLWTTTLSNAIGRAEISALSVGARKVSGTFSFNRALPANGLASGAGAQNISNGVFTDVSF